MRDLLRRLPGDLLLYGRVFGLITGAVWVAMGSLIVLPIAVAALTIVFGTIVYSWTAQATRGRTFTLTTAPIGLVLTDLVAASLWMVATAPDPRSVAFALVLIASVFVQFRLGRLGIAISATAFALAVTAQQLVLVVLGAPVELQPVFRQGIVVGLVLLVVGVVATAYRDEQERAVRALRRAHLLVAGGVRDRRRRPHRQAVGSACTTSARRSTTRWRGRTPSSGRTSSSGTGCPRRWSMRSAPTITTRSRRPWRRSC